MRNRKQCPSDQRAGRGTKKATSSTTNGGHVATQVGFAARRCASPCPYLSTVRPSSRRSPTPVSTEQLEGLQPGPGQACCLTDASPYWKRSPNLTSREPHQIVPRRRRVTDPLRARVWHSGRLPPIKTEPQLLAAGPVLQSPPSVIDGRYPHASRRRHRRHVHRLRPQ